MTEKKIVALEEHNKFLVSQLKAQGITIQELLQGNINLKANDILAKEKFEEYEAKIKSLLEKLPT